MIPPRYRTLDGDEVELPLAMDSWVLVPRELARFDPELAWALDYDDAPQPGHGDPRLDFSDGALLVPVDRWNEHAELEPNLAPCYRPQPRVVRAPAAPSPYPKAETFGDGPPRRSCAAAALRATVHGLAALASTYVCAVGAWLWTLRHGISGPAVSTGLVLVGAAVLLAWLGGLLGAGWPARVPARGARRTWRELGGALRHVADDPLGILRAGMTLQLTGFAVFVLVR